jgi:ribose transport system substrate-binding protein
VFFLFANVKLVGIQDGSYLANDAYPVVQTALAAHPQLNVVATTGDQMTLGAQRAVAAAGKTGKVKLIGAFASQLGVSAVARHEWFGDTVSLPYTEGEAAVKMLVAAVRNQPLPYPTRVPTLESPLNPLGSQLVTAGNVANFKAQWTG